MHFMLKHYKCLLIIITKLFIYIYFLVILLIFQDHNFFLIPIFKPTNELYVTYSFKYLTIYNIILLIIYLLLNFLVLVILIFNTMIFYLLLVFFDDK